MALTDYFPNLMRTLYSSNQRYLAALLGLAATALLPMSVSHATDDVEELQLAWHADLPPYMDETSLNGGIFADIVEASFAEVGVSVKQLQMPTKRAYVSVQAGTATGTVVWGDLEGGAKDLLQTKPFFHLAHVIYTSLPSFQTVEQLDRLLAASDAPRAMCLPLGWDMAPALQAYIDDGGMSVITPPSFNECMSTLINGRVSLTYLPRFTAALALQQAMEKAGDDPLRLAKIRRLNNLPFLKSKVRLVFQPTFEGEHFRTLFNLGLARIVKNGTYRAIVVEHANRHPAVDRDAVLSDLAAIDLITLP